MPEDNKNVGAVGEYERHVAENSGDYQVKSKKYENIIAKVLCVLAAVVLWFYVVGTDSATDETTVSGVAVAIRGLDRIEEELGLSVISGYDCVVDLTVLGTKSSLSRLNVEDITAFVDASTITEAGEYTLEVHTSLPSGVTSSGKSTNFVTLYVDKRTTVSVPVIVEPSFTIESAYTLGTPEPSVEMVNVTGPAEELEKIAGAKVILDLGRVTKTLTATGKLTLVDNSNTPITNPYVRLQTSEVSVRIPVYTYKDIPLSVDYKYGYYNESNVTVNITPATIRIKGEPDDLEKIDRLVVLQLDEKKIIGDTTLSATIMLPEDVENVSPARTADIAITHRNTETREIVVSSLTVVNPNSLKYSLGSPTINVSFRGPRSLITLLNKNNVTATVDLGYLNNASGTVSVPVTISVTNVLAGSVYEIGEYKMDVTIG
ncbi:MAG: hypothetical protein E7632_00525 [Ruminococcaceae bacterium]|nr:hypothetical protein [Oscillospiraceae bacterium]